MHRAALNVQFPFLLTLKTVLEGSILYDIYLAIQRRAAWVQHKHREFFFFCFLFLSLLIHFPNSIALILLGNTTKRVKRLTSER